MSTYDPAIRTRTLARIVGPYQVIMGATLLARQSVLPQVLSDFMRHDPLVLATGAFTLMAGLTMIALHHHWSGAAAIVISLIGIAVALKGTWLMIVPTLGAEMTDAVARAPSILLTAAGVELLLGLWLSFVGWLSKDVAIER
jgi:hypothetical protein